MDRRFVSAGAAALLLHAALLALRWRTPEAAGAQAVNPSETSIDLLPVPREPPALVESLAASAPRPADPALSPRPRPRRSEARAVVERVPLHGTELSTAVPEATEPAPPEAVPAVPDSEPAHPPKSLTLAQLGVGRVNSWAQPPEGARDRPAEDAAGLKRELMADDTRLGLGPGGAVAARVRSVAQDLAPLDSAATLSIDLSSAGAIEEISIDEVSSQMLEWRKVCRALRQRLDKPFAVRGAVRIRLQVSSESTTRSGKSHGGLTFDLSDIGSPTMQVVHVRVLAQLAR